MMKYLELLKRYSIRAGLIALVIGAIWILIIYLAKDNPVTQTVKEGATNGNWTDTIIIPVFICLTLVALFGFGLNYLFRLGALFIALYLVSNIHFVEKSMDHTKKEWSDTFGWSNKESEASKPDSEKNDHPKNKQYGGKMEQPKASVPDKGVKKECRLVQKMNFTPVFQGKASSAITVDPGTYQITAEDNREQVFFHDNGHTASYTRTIDPNGVIVDGKRGTGNTWIAEKKGNDSVLPPLPEEPYAKFILWVGKDAKSIGEEAMITVSERITLTPDVNIFQIPITYDRSSGAISVTISKCD